MRSRAEVARREDIAFDAIVRAAQENRPCPSNGEICDLVGAESEASGVRLLNSLEKRGRVAVTRFNTGREVFVPSLGISTAAFTGKRNPHWRTTSTPRPAQVRELAAVPAANDPDRPDDENLPPAVYRDPCPRCGTRADHGCGHNHVALSMGAFS